MKHGDKVTLKNVDISSDIIITETVDTSKYAVSISKKEENDKYSDPVQQIFSSEAEDISDEFSYVMTTDQNEAPMPEESRNLQYFWTMKNNVGAEIIMKVRKVGRYQYKIYQTSEKKDNLKNRKK